MKKLFILPLALLLLASCGGGQSSGSPAEDSSGTPGSTGVTDSSGTGTSTGTSISTAATDWDAATKSNMTSSIGIVLPFIAVEGVDLQYAENYFSIYGNGDAALLTSYRTSVEVDFNYVSTLQDSYGDDMLIFESKSTSVNVRIEMQHYIGQGGAGVIIVNAYKYANWPTAALTALGISDAPTYPGEVKMTYYPISFTDGSTGLLIYVFGGTAATYTTTLEGAGFTVADLGDIDVEYEGQFLAEKDGSDTIAQFYDNGAIGVQIAYYLYEEVAE